MRWWSSFAAGLLIVAIVALAIKLRAPLSVTGVVDLPAPVESLTARDRVAYPAHVVLGSILETLKYPPPAVGVQWLKAAYHARDGQRMERATAGVAAARARSTSTSTFDSTLCELRDSNGRFDHARTGAGVTCANAKVVPTWMAGPPDNKSTLSVVGDKVKDAIKWTLGWR